MTMDVQYSIISLMQESPEDSWTIAELTERIPREYRQIEHAMIRLRSPNTQRPAMVIREGPRGDRRYILTEDGKVWDGKRDPTYTNMELRYVGRQPLSKWEASVAELEDLARPKSCELLDEPEVVKAVNLYGYIIKINVLTQGGKEWALKEIATLARNSPYLPD